ncbi:MAG: glycosyltransferase family 2 protein [Actinomycetota bacterium]|nr:glycosyltransferase family 2 protein [Actinomycetota bacterium]
MPTYHRPELLIQCLHALAAQTHRARNVIVVCRADDKESKRALATIDDRRLPLVVVTVTDSGVIAATSAGVARSTAPFVAFTDDDSQPQAEWLEKVVGRFRDQAVGGVGGRDLVVGNTLETASEVGIYRWSGKLVGNHHAGEGPAREVDVLKGVNMAFRVEALALPAPGILRGEGAQVDFELLMCAWTRRQGWRVLYDPAILVDHYPGPRRGADQRIQPEWRAVFDAAYNSIIATAILEQRVPVLRIGYPIAIGSRDRPGLVRGAVALFRRESDVLSRLVPALAGRLFAVLKLLLSTSLRQGAVVVLAKDLRHEL